MALDVILMHVINSTRILHSLLWFFVVEMKQALSKMRIFLICRCSFMGILKYVYYYDCNPYSMVWSKIIHVILYMWWNPGLLRSKKWFPRSAFSIIYIYIFFLDLYKKQDWLFSADAHKKQRLWSNATQNAQRLISVCSVCSSIRRVFTDDVPYIQFNE